MLRHATSRSRRWVRHETRGKRARTSKDDGTLARRRKPTRRDRPTKTEGAAAETNTGHNEGAQSAVVLFELGDFPLASEGMWCACRNPRLNFSLKSLGKEADAR